MKDDRTFLYQDEAQNFKKRTIEHDNGIVTMYKDNDQNHAFTTWKDTQNVVFTFSLDEVNLYNTHMNQISMEKQAVTNERPG